MAWWADFAVEAAAGLLGVFAGVLLALLTERRRQRREQAHERQRLQEELGDARRAILGSVVRNTSEAQRVRGALADRSDDYAIRLNFELAVWEAAHAHYVRLAPLDERLLFAKFFDQVRRLSRLIDFLRQLRADSILGSPEVNRASPQLQAMESRVLEVAEDLRLAGVVIVTDHGETMHQRLLGTHRPSAQATPA